MKFPFSVFPKAYPFVLSPILGKKEIVSSCLISEYLIVKPYIPLKLKSEFVMLIFISRLPERIIPIGRIKARMIIVKV